MSIAVAIRQNAPLLGQAQTDYKTSVANVNMAMTGVVSSSLPALNQNPPDWSDFQTAYLAATTGALEWADRVYGRLEKVPGDVQNYNKAMTDTLGNAATQASTLTSDPNNSGALSLLNADLTTLSSTLSLVVEFIEGSVKNIESFGNDTLPGIATNLQTIATKSSTDAGADQQKINDLNSAISQLQADINSNIASIVALAIADAIALTLGIVATVAAFPFGLAAWLFAGPAIAAASYQISLDAQNIKNDQAQIAQKQQAITGISADVATLQLLTTQFTGLATQTQQVQDDLQTVLAAWQALEADVNSAISDIQSATSDTSNADYSAVAADLNNASTEWTTAYDAAGSLQLDLQVNNAQLTPGMSSDEVNAALAAGQVFDIMDYYAQFG